MDRTRYPPPLCAILIRALGIVDLPEYNQSRPPALRFTFDPFPYLPPELIVSVLSHTPADSLPLLYQTNHFFRLHIDVYRHQLIAIRTRRYPHEIVSAYTSIHSINFDSLHTSPQAWQSLSKFEHKADLALRLESLLSPLKFQRGQPSHRFYRAFLRQWESRRTMFFPKEQWAEALLDRFHIYEDCSRSEICDIVHLQMLYRTLLARLPWNAVIPNDSTTDSRTHWWVKSDLYRSLVDQIIGCGPEFILILLTLPTDAQTALLQRCLALFEAVEPRQVRHCCFDDVMSKLLTRLDGGTHAASRWQEEESYFDVCAATNWFNEGDTRTTPIRYRVL